LSISKKSSLNKSSESTSLLGGCVRARPENSTIHPARSAVSQVCGKTNLHCYGALATRA